MFRQSLNPIKVDGKGDADEKGQEKNIKCGGEQNGPDGLKHRKRDDELLTDQANITQPWRQGVWIVLSHAFHSPFWVDSLLYPMKRMKIGSCVNHRGIKKNIFHENGR